MALIKGIFKPPLIGSQEAPIKIAGPGQCEVTSNGLKIIGFKQLPKINTFQLLALFFGLFFGLAIIKAAFWRTMPNGLMSIPFAVAIYPFIQGQGNDYRQGDAIELLVPWENITYARLDKVSNVVIIRVKKFRHQGDCYQGALFFEPTDGAAAMLDTLSSSGVKCKG
jgi:hypothetical protein